MTVVTGVPLPDDELEELASRLKRLCGAGGAVKDRVIEIQGEHRDRVITALTAYGWIVRRSGG